MEETLEELARFFTMALTSEEWSRAEYFWKKVAKVVSLATWPALAFNMFEEFVVVFQVAKKDAC